jgi:hypothetical protein
MSKMQVACADDAEIKIMGVPVVVYGSAQERMRPGYWFSA